MNRKIWFRAAVVILFAAGLFFTCRQLSSHPQYHPPMSETGVSYENAVVVRVVRQNLTDNADAPGLYAGTQTVQLHIQTGTHKGETLTAQNYLSPQQNVYCRQGMHVIVRISAVSGTNFTVTVFNYYHTPYLILLVLLFLAGLCVIGGRKGVRSVISIVVTFICILYLFVPMLFDGYNPMLSAVLLCAICTVVTMLLLNGWSALAATSICGTMAGVAIAALTAAAFGGLMHMNGYQYEDAETLMVVANQTHIQIKGLLFAAILIASLGAVMDIAVSITSCVQEIYSSNPGTSGKQLFLSGIHVGRDMMGTMATTLLLAFTGASLTTLLVLYSYQVPLREMMNLNMVSMEVTQGVAGSFAIVLTVPIVSLIGSVLIPRMCKRESRLPGR